MKEFGLLNCLSKVVIFPVMIQLCFFCHVNASVLLGQTSEISIGGWWSGNVTLPPTIIGMQFFVSLNSYNELFTNASYGGGAAAKINESLLTNALGGSLHLSKGQTGVYDFSVTNGISFSNIVAALMTGTNAWGTNDYVCVGGIGYNNDRIVTGGGGMVGNYNNSFWGLPNGPLPAGTRIDFFRLIVTSVDWGATNGGFQITGKAQWQIYGVTNQTSNSQCATATATLSGTFVVSVSITEGGSGYTNTPLVRIIGGGGSGAGAYAVVSNGVVTSITVTNAGYGYTNAPLVVIDPPFISNPVLGIAPMSFLTFSNLTIGGSLPIAAVVGVVLDKSAGQLHGQQMPFIRKWSQVHGTVEISGWRSIRFRHRRSPRHRW